MNEQKVIEQLQTLPDELLTAIARGEIDILRMMALELSNRGLNEGGSWIGFKKAEVNFKGKYPK